MKIRLFLYAIALLCTPSAAQAAVIINEVAWMGDVDSANNEWIELYNTSDSSVAITDWRLTDGANIDMTLMGSIGAGDFATLERTDDDAAPGSAFHIYTGALSNNGSTLTLYRGDGSIADQIAGGEHWEELGGDNTTKETAQYSTKGWITAASTPGQANALMESVATEKPETKRSSFSSGVVVPKTKLLVPNTTLQLTISAPTIGYVNQAIDVSVTPSGIGKAHLESLQYRWNFGDVHTGSGRERSHTYQYPGEYVIQVQGEYARHDTIARHVITILPVAFSLTRASDGAVQIHNDAKYEIDVSGYIITGAQPILFPDHTVILPGKTITIADPRITSRPVTVVDTSGVTVATESTQPAPVSAPVKTTYVPPAQSADTLFTHAFASGPQIDVSTSSIISTTSVPALELTDPVTATDRRTNMGLLGVLAVALMALGITRKKPRV